MLKNVDVATVIRHPRLRKWGLRFVVALLVAGLVGFLAVPPLLKWGLTAGLGDALQRTVRVEAVRFNPYTLTLTVEGLSIAERAAEGGGASGEQAAELAGFDRLRVNAEIASLFVAGVIVKELSLEGPRLHLTRQPDGRYNISDLIDTWTAPPAADAATEGSVPRFSVSNIQLAGGRLEFDDRLEGVQHTVSDLTLGLPFVSSLSFNTETYVEPHFSAAIDGAPVVLTGKSRPFAESHESELTLDLDHLELARYWAYSPVELPMRIDRGALDGQLRLRFVQGDSQPTQFVVDGHLALSDFRLVAAAGDPLLAIRRVDLALRQADLIKRGVGIERIAIEAPEIDVRIDPQGKVSWLTALTPKRVAGKPIPKAAPDTTPESSPESAPATPPSAAVTDAGSRNKEMPVAASPFRVTVDSVEVREGTLRLVDRSTGSEQRAIVGNLSARADGYDSAGEKPLMLSATARLDAGERLRVADIAVRDAALDLNRHTLHIGEYAMRGLQAKLERTRNGALQFLAPPQIAATPAPAAAKAAPAASSPWQVAVDKVTLSDHALRFEDHAFKPAAVQTLAIESLSAANVSMAPDGEATVAAKMRVNKEGVIEVDGTVQPLRPAATLQVRLDRLELLPLQPYFGEHLNLTVTRGRLTAKGELSVAAGADRPDLRFKGDLTLGDFHSVDKINAASFLRWRSFHVRQIDVASHPLSLAIGQVALSDFFARLIVSPAGRLNLLQIVKTADSEPAAPSAEPPAKPDEAAPAAGEGRAVAPIATAPVAEPVPVRIDRVTLQGGRINFSDHFIKPNYSATLTQLTGRVTGLSSKAGTTADLELRGSYEDLAPLTVTAKLNPFAAQSSLDLNAEVRGIELSGLSPYSGKYAGYAIEKGKLSLYLNYKIAERQLVAENRIFLDQLTFGEKVDSPDATTLPVTLAVSLLKNRAGEIDVNLPIAGSLDDPEFSIGGVVVRVIVNLFVKAVTSPFALLGSIFGGGEELAYVEFDYGYATLSAPMRERLQTLAKALVDRPGLKVEIAGRIDPANDREGLKQAMMMRRVKAKRLEELLAQGTEAGSVDDVKIADKDYPRYLEKAYRAEDFPKPRNVIGFTKTLPVEEMEKLMLANMNADDEALHRLADRRARNVAQWLTTEGKVASERVFVLQPNMKPAAGPQQESARTSRVDFSLK